MADKKESSSSKEKQDKSTTVEYKLPKEEYSSQYEPPSSPAEAAARHIGPSLKSRRVLLVFLFITTFYITYQIISSKRPDVKKHDEAKHAIATVVAHEAKKSAEHVTLSEVQVPQISTPSVKDDLSDLKQQGSDHQNQLSDLQSDVDAMHRSMDQLSVQIQTVSDHLIKMNQQMHQFLLSKQKKNVVKKKVHKIYRMAYKVRAAVPGRAWLVSELGQTLTVAVGDVVPGWGSVTQIVPSKLIVTTKVGQFTKTGSNAH